MNNQAVRQPRRRSAEFVLFLNNDIEATQDPAGSNRLALAGRQAPMSAASAPC